MFGEEGYHLQQVATVHSSLLVEEYADSDEKNSAGTSIVSKGTHTIVREVMYCDGWNRSRGVRVSLQFGGARLLILSSGKIPRFSRCLWMIGWGLLCEMNRGISQN